MKPGINLERRTLLVAALGSVLPTSFAKAQAEITRPAVSEGACPLEIITPIASDGYKGLAVLRKPPGDGRFPAVVCLHGGMVALPLSQLQAYARDAATPTRFLAAGYVVVLPTYRSRDVDPQSPVSLRDSLAAVDYARKLPYVDAESIVVYGCSGGGDLALEVAAQTNICAVVPEEPAIMMMAGMFTTRTPKRGERYSPVDSFFLLDNPKPYYTPELQRFFRAKLAKIECPIFLVQGDPNRLILPISKLNGEVLIPELLAVGKTPTVRSYSGQMHCFCFESGLPWPAGRSIPPESWAQSAMDAFLDIDTFNRQYLKTKPKAIDRALVTYVAVRQ